MKHNTALIALLVAALLAGGAASASDDHDHGDAAPTAAGEAAPRFTATSETFELVGVLNGKQITLYLDRYADNSPVRDARIELDITGVKFNAAKQGDAAYEVVLADVPKPGVLAITATVTAGAETDLLAGELDVHEAAHVDEAAEARPWAAYAAYAGWAAGGVAVLLLLVWVIRRVTAARNVRAGSVA